MAFYRRAVVSVVVSSLLLCVSFSFVSLNVFAVPVERHVGTASLKSVWTRALGLTSIVDSLSTFLTGVYFNQFPSSAARAMGAVPMSLFYLSLALCKPALKASSATGIYIAVLLQGVPYGYFYLLGLDGLNQWMVQYPALAMALVSASYGLSQVAFSPLFYAAVTRLGVVDALCATALGLCVCACLFGLVVRFPTESDLSAMRATCTSSPSHATQPESLTQALLPADTVSNGRGAGSHDVEVEVEVADGADGVVPWHRIMRSAAFYRYLGVAFVSRAAVGLLTYFFKLGYVLGVSTRRVVVFYQVLCVGGVSWAFCVNALYEYLTRRFKRPMVRPFLIGTCLAQALLYLLLIVLTLQAKHTAALVTAAVIIALLESQTAYSVLLASDAFGHANGTTAFGLAGGLAMCPAEAFFALLLSVAETLPHADKGMGVPVPSCYIPAYVVSATGLFLGAVLVAFQ